MAVIFFDTSVLVYMLSEADARAEKAEALLTDGGVVSVQVLNEFINVARRKYRMDWEELEETLDDIRSVCGRVLSIDLADHEKALHVARRYGYRIFDALHIAVALRAGCDTFYSEDMQHDRGLTG
ncbi:MAG TPA: PIN domain-containing protein [Acidobacteriaceae bacterium]|nr:PIN domain-containing protein [Acidobacteriaceae bacterium]